MHARLARAEVAYLQPVSLSPAEERIAALRIAAEEAHWAALRRGTWQFLARIGDALLGWVERARIRAELESLTDRDLADIGLSRGDLDRVVRGSGAQAAEPEPRRPARPAGRPVPQPA